VNGISLVAREFRSRSLNPGCYNDILAGSREDRHLTFAVMDLIVHVVRPFLRTRKGTVG